MSIAHYLKVPKIGGTLREQEYYEHLANLYSIIRTLDRLEKAYIRDTCSSNEYTSSCQKLLSQYKSAQKVEPIDLTAFVKQYNLDCKAAIERIEAGVPATVDIVITRTVAEAVQYFITAMDSLKLNMVAVDQLQPLLVDLLDILEKVPSIPTHFEGKIKVKEWLDLLARMKASDELDEEQSRQLLFDLESAYTAFHKVLSA